jgi:hypothetical protein
MGGKQAYVCMEATGRHSLGIALALYDPDYVVSVVNPARIRNGPTPSALAHSAGRRVLQHQRAWTGEADRLPTR